MPQEAAEGRTLDPETPMPWYEAGASGWRPTLAEVRAGSAARPEGRAARPRVRDTKLTAILVPLFEEAGEAHVVLIERPMTDSGDLQVTFPGGVLRAAESPTDAALRETRHAIGIAPADVEILCSLDDVATVTGYLVRPFVTAMRRRPVLRPSPAEVARAITVPLGDLAGPHAHWREGHEPVPERRLHHFRVADTVGWGATGTVLAELLQTALAGRMLPGE